MNASVTRGRETGNRHRFIARAAVGAAAKIPHNLAHPLGDVVPTPLVVSASLDAADLVGSFVRNAEALGVVVHPELDDQTLREIVEFRTIRRAVYSEAPPAQAVGARLESLGVQVAPYDRSVGAAADLGITSPVAGLATTGSLVQDNSVDGSRGASLLPRVHLALVSRATIVASTADVLRGRTTMPSNLVFMTGPSRTGDIEMIITVGVHGPVAVHIALTD